MYEYYKLNISLDKQDNKLYRTILFNPNNDLDELAFTVLSIFNTASYHLYSFSDKRNTYMCELGIIDSYEPDKDKPTENVTIDSLKISNNHFTMEYDFGDQYVFNIRILERVKEPKLFHIARVIDGKGYGIAEDQHYELDKYLNGEECDYPVTFFYKGRFNVTHDFNDFQIDKCNKKLYREISKIRGKYLYYDLDN